MSYANLVTIDFHGDPIFVHEQDGKAYVAVNPICKRLGLAPQMQRKRIERDPILSKGVIVVITQTPAGEQETFLLRDDLAHGWLFTIDESRVKDAEVRERVLIYKEECFRVLHEHFSGKKLAKGYSDPSTLGELSIDQKQRDIIQARLLSGPRAAWQLRADYGFHPIPPPPACEQMTFWDANGPKLKLVSGDEE